jgi:hypothetical protein
MLAAEPIHTEMEIYDATFSSQTVRTLVNSEV